MFEVSTLIAVVIALTQLVKNTGIDTKYAPFVALALGITLSFFFTEGQIEFRVMTGVLMGLSASGLYDAVKLPAIAAYKASQKRDLDEI